MENNNINRKRYKVVSECDNLEVWAVGFYGDSGRERAQKRIDERYWHNMMYEKDKHKTLIVIEE